MGVRVFSEVDLEGDAKDFNNYSQLVKTIKNIEMGYIPQENKRKRKMDYDEEIKYYWYHLHKQKQSWNRISREYNETHPGSNTTRNSVRKAVERLFD